ncbi:O-antigen translocase [Cloacibacterium normanense]|uniref:O-antigen translocase n=1 Tax=Cloacibacterium normanense TaxID=237258 RepID=UPI0035B0DD95
MLPIVFKVLQILKKISGNDLVKVFSFTGLSTFVKLVTGYVSIKVVASVIGPAGIALLGQLQNFVSIFTTLGAGGINNGVVKYVAEYRESETTLQKFISTGLRITVFFSLLFGMVMMLFSKTLSRWILLDEKYYYVFLFFGITLLLLSLNNFLLSVINGFKEFKKYVVVNIVTSLLGLLFTVFLVLMCQLEGALIAVVTYQSVVFFATILMIRKSPWFSWANFRGTIDKAVARKYLSYSLMALVTAATVPVSQLLIRKYLINNLSLDAAGYWEAMNRVSSLYMMFVTTTLSIYYLPKLSETKDSKLRNEVSAAYKIIIPFVVISLTGMFFLKDMVVQILFTPEFSPMKELFFWQLLGDFFKVTSWILAFIMVAKAMTKVFVFTEIFFGILLVMLTYFFINISGFQGVAQAYCINYFLYLLFMILIFRKLLFKKSTV